MKSTVALIVMGGLVLLGVVAAGAVARDRDQERVAEFYKGHATGTTLPYDLHPKPFGPSEAFGFLAGGVMVAVGIWRSRGLAS